jgi:hypothetical protein
MALFGLAASRIELSMACTEKLRLQQLYEVAIRRWGQVQATSQLFGPPTLMTETMLKKALAERNAAKNRLVMHQQNCKKCNPEAVYRGKTTIPT